MKKEVLLSLLMTTPVAFPALADIDLTHLAKQPTDVNEPHRWTADGGNLAGTSVQYGTDDLGLVCMKDVKSVTRTYTLPRGAYKLNFTGKNNCKITVKVGNGTATTDFNVNIEGHDVTGFRVPDTKDTETVTIVVTPDFPKGSTAETWGFSKMSLVLAYEFTGTTLTDIKAIEDKVDAKVINPLTEGVVNAAITANETALKNLQTELGDAARDIQAKAANAEKAAQNAKALFDAYKKWQFYKTPNLLKSKSDKFLSDVDAHNKNVKAANDKYANYTDNKKQKETFLNWQKTTANGLAVTVIPELKKILDTATENKEEKKKNYEAALQLQKDVNAFEKTVIEAYADLDAKIDHKVYVTIKNDLDKTYRLLRQATNPDQVDADVKAYLDFSAPDPDKPGSTASKNYQLYTDLYTSYMKYKSQLGTLKGVEGSEDAFATAITTRFERELSEAYNSVLDLVIIDTEKQTISLKEIAGAADKPHDGWTEQGQASTVKNMFINCANSYTTDTDCKLINEKDGVRTYKVVYKFKSFAAIYDEALSFVNRQNIAKEKSKSVLEALNTRYNASAAKTVPTNLNTNELKTAKNNAAGVISKYKSHVDASYANAEGDYVYAPADWSTETNIVLYPQDQFTSELVSGDFSKFGISQDGAGYTSDKQIAYDNMLATIGGAVDLATRVTKMQNAVNAVNHPKLTALTSTELANAMKDVNALTTSDLTGDKFTKATATVNNLQAILLNTDANDAVIDQNTVGLIEAFKNAYCTADVAGLDNYINDFKLVENADLNKQNYLNKMVINVYDETAKKNVDKTYAAYAKELADGADAAIAKLGNDVAAIKVKMIDYGKKVEALKKAVVDLRKEFTVAAAKANAAVGYAEYNKISGACQHETVVDAINDQFVSVSNFLRDARTKNNEIQNFIRTLDNGAYDEEDCIAVYDDVMDLLEEIDARHALVQPLLDNVYAYNDFVKELNKIYPGYNTTQSALGKLESYIEEHVGKNLWPCPEAYDFFMGKIRGKDGFENQVTAIKTDLETALKASSDKNVLARFDEFNEKISNLNTAISNTKTDIDKNETWHNKILAEHEVVRGLVDQLKDKVAANPGFNPWKDDYDKVVNGISGIYDDIQKAYNTGVAEPSYLSLSSEIAKLNTLANSVLEKFSTDYENQVRKHNNDYLNTWVSKDGVYGKLFTEFTRAFNVTSQYPNIDNKLYRAFVDTDTHAKDSKGVTLETPQKGFGKPSNVSDYMKLISELNTNATKYINDRTGEVKVVDDNDATFKKDYIDVANRYKSDISKYEADMTFWLNESAEKYSGYVKAKVNNKNTAVPGIDGYAMKVHAKHTANSNFLESVGVKNIENKDSIAPADAGKITVAVLKNHEAIKAALEKAGLDYRKALDSKVHGLKMDEIADVLDGVHNYTPEEFQAYGKAYYEGLTSTFKTRLDAWTTNIKEFKQDKDLGDNTKGHIKAFNDAVTAYKNEKTAVDNEIKAANYIYFVVPDGTATAADAPAAATKDLKGWTGRLQDKYNAVKNAYKTSFDAHNKNVVAADTYKKFIADLDVTGDKAGVRTLFNTLKAFANDIAASNKSYAEAETALNEIIKLIEDNQADYTTVIVGTGKSAKDYINSKIDAFKNNLDDYYMAVADAETVALSSELNIVTEALSALELTPEDLQTKMAELTDIQYEIVGTKNGSLGWNILKAKGADSPKARIDGIVALKGDMLAMESRIAGLENEYKAQKPAADALNALQARWNEVNAKVDEAVKYYESCHESVKPLFADFGKADYAGKMNSLKESMDNAGAVVIVHKDNYLVKMSDIEAAVVKALADMKVKQEPINASIKREGELNTTYNNYVEKYETLKNAIKNAEYYKYQGYDKLVSGVTLEDQIKTNVENFETKLDDIKAKLDAAKKDLDENAKKFKLTKDSKLKNDADLSKEAEGKAGSVAIEFSQAMFDGSFYFWDNAVAHVTEAFKNPFLLDERKAALIEAATKIGEERKEFGTTIPKATGKQKQIDVNKKAVETMRGFIERLEQVVVDIADSSFKPGDVTDDKKVDVTDVQTVINWILEDIDYATVEAESPIKAKAADLNHDKKFGIGDAVLIARLASSDLTEDFFIPKAKTQGANLVSTSLVSREGGVSRYAVNVNNSVEFVGGQIDLVLPAGMSLVGVEGAERVENHSMFTSTSNERIVLMNMENASIEGSNGAVVYVDVIGDGNLAVENVVFADKTGASYVLGQENGTSGIEDAVIDNNGGLKQRIYNAAGQMLRGLQRGVNIIRNADGSVSKEYRK